MSPGPSRPLNLIILFLLVFFVSFAMVVGTGSVARAEVVTARVLIDGKPLPDRVPVVVEGEALLLPAVLIADLLGITLSYDPTQGSVIFTRGQTGSEQTKIELKVDDDRAFVNGTELGMTWPVRAFPGMVAVPAGLANITGEFEVTWDKRNNVVSFTRPGSHLSLVSDLRYSVYPDKVRVVLELTSPATYRVTQTESPSRVIVDLDEVYLEEIKGLTATDVTLAGIGVEVSPGNQGRVSIDLKYPLPSCNVYVLDNPDRIVLDIPKLYDRRFIRSPVEGLTYTHFTRGTPNGPVVADVLEVDLTNPYMEVRPAIAQGENGGFGREIVPSMVARNGAIAGINAGYFDQIGHPLGIMMVDGEVASEPILRRSTLGIARDKTVLIDNLDLTVWIEIPGGSYKATGINRKRMQDELIIYTPRYGPTTLTNESGLEVVVEDGRVASVGRGNSLIPSRGYVISAHGASRESFYRLKSGDLVSLGFRFEPDWPGLGVIHAVGGGPRLLKEGKVCITSEEEKFKSDVTGGWAPRTAVGYAPSGKLMLVTVNGRQPGLSVGMTLEELAAFMLELGAMDAVNLDGGGSTIMVLEGQIVNVPSDGQPRKVGGALLVYANPPVPPASMGGVAE